MPDTPRLSALDGLRGLAALIVVVHHGLLTFPRLADAYYSGAVRGEGPSWAWVVTYTPLHIGWAGTEAVYLFFVLSGMVLTLPVLAAGREFSWFAYLPRRLVRLYVPVAAAVVLGGVLAVAVPRLVDPALGPWVSGRPAYTSLAGVIQDVVLLFGSSGVVSPLWSLQWEVLFSLLLGVFVLWAVVGRRWWWAKVAALLVVMGIAHWAGSDVLFYLPMFALGALLIVEWDRIRQTLSRLHTVGWIAWTLVAVVLTTVRWTLLGLGFGVGVVSATQWIAVVGVSMLILAAAFWRPASALLTTRFFSWLGRISFSLYLVHEPIIVSTRLLTPSLSPAVGLAISVPVAFAVAVLFSVAVEQPAHRLSKRVGRLAASAMPGGASRVVDPSPSPRHTGERAEPAHALSLSTGFR